jgi:hypothetical protein
MGTIYEEDWDQDRQQYVSSRKCGKPLGPDAPHYPNKSEHKALVKLMQASGMSEDEVRAVKANRQLLANARKEPTKSGDTDRRQLRIKRYARQLAKSKNIPIWEAQKQAGLDLAQSRNRWL